MSVLNRVKEKRLSTRLLLSVPVAIEPPSDPGRPRPLPQSCTSIDVSDRGIGLACSSPIDLTDCVLVLKIPGNDGITLPGRLCWSARDPKTNSCRYGFAFAGEDGPEKTRLRRHLADLLLDRTRIGGRKVPTTIQSDLISFTNRRGKRIVAFYDHPVGEIYKPDTPFVVMPPAYGEHKTTALLPAYTFAANGFHALPARGGPPRRPRLRRELLPGVPHRRLRGEPRRPVRPQSRELRPPHPGAGSARTCRGPASHAHGSPLGRSRRSPPEGA
ncbi:MAG: PilZ domain-containing protein [Nitrospirae bacterium]|nr:PilZ domain-containing protein [Nitrospirota bacterium]